MARTYEAGGIEIHNADVVGFVGDTEKLAEVASAVPSPRFYEDAEDSRIAVCDVVFTTLPKSEHETIPAKDGARIVTFPEEEAAPEEGAPKKRTSIFKKKD